MGKQIQSGSFQEHVHHLVACECRRVNCLAVRSDLCDDVVQISLALHHIHCDDRMGLKEKGISLAEKQNDSDSEAYVDDDVEYARVRLLL
ncbi:unnamed protein product [Strongylus vulgaris]|uniref:Uncharacterized protein n=1 Tax=Strongylus vulgaris TaxID=40348 RepID=A0A3P7L894_STRVU|nr:unnamed protein product [Strongylus vulgaris]